MFYAVCSRYAYERIPSEYRRTACAPVASNQPSEGQERLPHDNLCMYVPILARANTGGKTGANSQKQYRSSLKRAAAV